MNQPEQIAPIDFIHTPDSWPRWPFLPLKRYVERDGWGQMELGVLMVTHHGYSFALGVNLWSRLAEAQFTPCSPEQLLSEGWEVD